jgi:hypothetical protein
VCVKSVILLLVCVWDDDAFPSNEVYKFVISDIGCEWVKSVIFAFTCVCPELLLPSSVNYKSVILLIAWVWPVSDLLFNEVYRFVISLIGCVWLLGVNVEGLLDKLLYEYGTIAVLISYEVKLVISLMVC